MNILSATDFMLWEEHKGMLGGLFVSPKYSETGVGEQEFSATKLC